VETVRDLVKRLKPFGDRETVQRFQHKATEFLKAA
jgi:hypothetical protein